MTTTPASAADNAVGNPFGLNLQARKPRKSPQLVQLVAIADATGSSSPFAKGIQHILSSLADELPQRIARVRFSLVASRDQDCGECDEALLTDGEASELRSALARLEFRGGEDADETHYWSVRDTLRHPWEEGPGRRKAIVLLGSSDSKPIPGLTLDQLVVQLGKRRITVFVVAPPESNLKRLADLGDGLFFPLSNEPSAEELQRLTSRLTASMTQTLSQTPSAAGSGETVVAL